MSCVIKDNISALTHNKIKTISVRYPIILNIFINR